MSENRMDWINEKVIPLINKFMNLKFVKCMQSAVTAAMPATIVGSIFMLLMIPPFAADSTNALAVAWRAFSAANAGWLNIGYQFGLNAAGFYIVIGMAIAVCKEDNLPIANNVVLAVLAFLCLECGFLEGGGVDIGFWGAKGMMAAMIIGFLVPWFNGWLMNHGVKIKLPEQVPPFAAEPINAMLANIIVAAAVFAVKLGLASMGQTVGTLVNGLFAPLFSGADTIWAVLFYCIFVRILWFFGLHGNNIAGSVVNPILTVNLVANAEAVMNGGQPTFIFNAAFQNWTTTGILAIVIAIMINAKSEQLKSISKIAIVPALFNIGEPLTFGLPLVLNFDILLPYLGVFAINGLVPYLACKMGFMTIPYVSIPFTVPAILKVFLMSMDFRAVIVYLVNMVLSILIITPAIRKYDRKLLAQERGEAE
ncbi:MAG: PTS sugar transporter subunit IIC [Erysipelotrichaceae bacterium]|nr:PTS sugar transporter subunit IIC [Erysipelotrichaceae bacterium]